MIVEIERERYVEWRYQDAQGGESILSIPLEVFLVFVQQTDTLEGLRCLLFSWPTRRTADAKRRAHKKALAAAG